MRRSVPAPSLARIGRRAAPLGDAEFEDLALSELVRSSLWALVWQTWWRHGNRSRVTRRWMDRLTDADVAVELLALLDVAEPTAETVN